ncbi:MULTISPECIES: PTS system mannose/fructose/sorbose family transporter subunit IID [Klebsiella]|uniref:PTS system mannose/fructose/sorbose family transporter subunit IID n=1 Tax=Klebsiella TaxID=570 RepID=UPI000CDE4CB8|nr:MULTISPECIES: PTS system mannose/fructose/sorbose family transporter subunit IID [Klebsiella]EKP1129009.1 PTS system mannose/fructose/sorbose family transporter subunit IID [Klebsiella michiganensis]EKV4192974.1 PTS system mannose/fructose/sorbose family transporter subunit IID [Klebsiella michiganensis]ELO7625250.1 PTS system mannose/fructose/sorbose family transporter subunit IID [Klebsiella michiganensis]KAB7492332.1 PTS system mannose/fructose/sorbose family transporter subunit IID [Kleb
MNKVLKRVFWRWFLFGQSGWNYEKMQGLGYLYSIYPFLEKKYAKPEEQKDAAKVHSQFFNTNNTMAPGILGVNIALEEQTGLAGKDAVAGIKTGLMGPLAGIGDTLFFVIPTTIIGSVASYLALQGNPVGLVLWLLFALVRMLFMRFSISKGYQEGVNLLGSLTNNLNKITRAANILGLTVIGALIPSVVKANLNFEFSYGEVSLKLQSIADQIMPGLIPLLVVGFTWWLLGLKKMNSTRVIFVLIALGIIGYNLNILG